NGRGSGESSSGWNAGVGNKQGYNNLEGGNSNLYRQRRVGSGVHGNQFQQKGSSFGRNNGVGGMSSGKNNSVMQDKEECVLEDMEEEYNSKIWPKLKQDVVDIMELGSYPSSSIRADWSLAQINFFYQNCSKYGLDPSLEDDDVATEDGGMAAEIRSEGDAVEARNSDMGGAPFNDVLSNV
nr:RNA-directed DNA polymerase, eukaryota, reverse transcriptase zinc-binding domain protein [Tanacetum cinerariifolium]